MFPGRPEYVERHVDNGLRRMKQVVDQQDQQYLADTHKVEENAVGATSWADIDAKGPDVAAARARLQWEQPLLYDQWDRRFNANADGKAESFGTNFSNYLSRALAPTNDPNRITNPAQLNAFVGAGKDAALTNSGIHALSDLTAIRGTPQGEAFATQARTILTQMHGDLTFSSRAADRFDAKGEQKFSEFSAVALPVLLNAYKSGNINQVLDPKSPDYLGKMAATFMRTPAQVLRDRLDYSDKDRARKLGHETEMQIGKDLLAEAVQKGRMSQAEAVRIGVDRGYWAPRTQTAAAAPTPGWKTGEAPPPSALPPIGQ